MKKKLLLLGKTILFLIILGICLFAVSLVVERKSSYDKNQLFFTEAKKDNIDAFILGSSHVINGINPAQLYGDYGYTAYNLGGFGSIMKSSYWQFKMALDYCTPKLVIVDSYMLENDIQYVDDPNANVNSEELHLNIDRFPLNKTKLDAINDLFEAQDKKYPFIADFIVYHDRWKELNADDFKRLYGKAEYNPLMGAVMEYGVHSAEFNYTDFQAGPLGSETVSTTYLRKIIEECKARDIQVLVVTLPFLAMQDGQMAAQTAEAIALESGVYSLNMLEIPGIIDLNNDMMDAGHLNVTGAQKVTSFLGSFIAQNLPLPDHREDAGYENWDEALSKYRTEIYTMAERNEDIYSQLMTLKLIAGERDVAISIRGGSAAYSDDTLMRQLRQLGAGDGLTQAINNRSSYMLIADHGQVYEFAGNGEEQHISTSHAELTYIPASEIYRVLYLGDNTEFNYLYSDEYAYTDVQLLIFELQEVRSHQYYTCDHFTYNYHEN